jgi:hypothetical protein
MQKIFKLNNSGDNLIVDINSNKKVNIKIGEEEINFFLGNPQFNDAEMSYMYNFLEHELAIGMAVKIHKEIGVIVGYFAKQEAPVVTVAPVVVAATNTSNLFGEAASNARTKRAYSKRRYNYKLFYVRIFDKQGQCVFERTNNFRTKMEARSYAIGIIKEIKMGSTSRIEISKF